MRKALGLLVISCMVAVPVVHAESVAVDALSLFLNIAQRDAKTALTLSETRALSEMAANSAQSVGRLTSSGLNAKGYYIVGSSEKRDMDVVVRAVGSGADDSANWAPSLAIQKNFNNFGTVEIGISRRLTVEEQGTVDEAAGLASESRIQNMSNRDLAEALDRVTRPGEGGMLLNRVSIGAVEGGLPEGDNYALGLSRLMKDRMGRWMLVRSVKVRAANLDVAVLQKMVREVKALVQN